MIDLEVFVQEVKKSKNDRNRNRLKTFDYLKILSLTMNLYGSSLDEPYGSLFEHKMQE